jgi:hypothetical protein
MEKQRTAIEFLIDNLHYSTSTKWKEIIKQAKAIEKEQKGYSEEDMVEYAEFCINEYEKNLNNKNK